MKKISAMLLALTMVFGLAACGGSNTNEDANSGNTGAEMKVAMISDYADITDQSFNQTTYEAMKEYCEANGLAYTYYKPVADNTAERVAMVDAAISEGYNVILMPGYAFGDTIKEVVDLYPDVKFIALDVSEGDLGDYVLPENAFSAIYQEELCGYMAGYAAVKLGYRHLGFMGGMAVPAVQRFGYGWLQGVDAAAKELGCSGEVTMEWIYANSFSGDADITAVMDGWYSEMGVECVFSCAAGAYASVAEAAQKVGGKMVGVDVDQAPIVDSVYGEGMTVTSAMKGLGATVKTMLAEVAAGNFSNYSGKVMSMGLVSENPEENYVQIPMSTQFEEGKFTEEDYKAMVAAMLAGEIVVSNAIEVMPEVSYTVNQYDPIK